MKNLFFLQFLIKIIFCQEVCPVSETLPDRSGFLQSPNYPENYPSSTNCRWVKKKSKKIEKNI